MVDVCWLVDQKRDDRTPPPPQTRVKGVVRHNTTEPTSCLVQPIVVHCCEIMYIGCIDFRGELGFLNSDTICMCVVNKQFELEFFLVRLC